MHASYDFKNNEGRPTFAAKDSRKYVFLLESYVVGQVFKFFRFFTFFEDFRIFGSVRGTATFVTKNNEKTLGGHDERS